MGFPLYSASILEWEKPLRKGLLPSWNNYRLDFRKHGPGLPGRRCSLTGLQLTSKFPSQVIDDAYFVCGWIGHSRLSQCQLAGKK